MLEVFAAPQTYLLAAFDRELALGGPGVVVVVVLARHDELSCKKVVRKLVGKRLLGCNV